MSVFSQTAPFNKSMKSPCLKCPDRRVEKNYNCHSECIKYIEYNEFNKMDRERRMSLVRASELDDMLFNNYSKRRRRGNKWKNGSL